MADVTFNAFAGINNTLPPERLAASDLTTADNVDIDNSGQVARRVGTTSKVSGAAHSVWAEGADCLYVQGASLKRLNIDFSSTTLATNLTPDLPANYLNVNDRIYWSNGAQTGIIVDGSNRSWGMAVPETAGLSVINGVLAAGKYQVVLTYMRNDGQESGAGMAALITLADNSGVRVTWSVPTDPTIIEVGVYLTEPNGEVLYQAGVADAIDGSADVTSIHLSLPLNTQWLDAPPAGQCLDWHRGRILIAAGRFLFASTALGYEYCDLRDYVALDDTTIRFVAAVEHGVFVGTERQVYFLAGDRLDEFVLTVVVDSPGIARSAVVADGFPVTGDARMAGMQVALFATGMGICLGNPDGSIVHLSRERYRFTATQAGAACFRNTDTLNQYLLFLQS